MITLRTVVLLSLDIPFTLLHVSVVIFILSTRRNDMMLRSGFYSLFVLNAIADVVHQLVTIIWQQLPIMFPFCLYLIDEDDYHWSLSSSIVNDVLNYVILLQAVCHTTIGFNRFSCFYASKLHERFWSGRRLKLVISAILLFSLSGVAYFIPYPSQIYPFGRDIAAISLFDSDLDDINLCVLAAWYIAFGLLNFVFSISTVFAIHSFRARVGSLTYNAEVRLFAHSLVMLILQLYLAFHYSYFSKFLPGWTYTENTQVAIGRVARFLIDTYNLSGSPFLLVLSPDVRRKYIAFYLGLEPKSRIVSLVRSIT